MLGPPPDESRMSTSGVLVRAATTRFCRIWCKTRRTVIRRSILLHCDVGFSELKTIAILSTHLLCIIYGNSGTVDLFTPRQGCQYISTLCYHQSETWPAIHTSKCYMWLLWKKNYWCVDHQTVKHYESDCGYIIITVTIHTLTYNQLIRLKCSEMIIQKGAVFFISIHKLLKLKLLQRTQTAWYMCKYILWLLHLHENSKAMFGLNRCYILCWFMKMLLGYRYDRVLTLTSAL